MKLTLRSGLFIVLTIVGMVITYYLGKEALESEDGAANLTYLFIIPTVLLVLLGNYLIDKLLNHTLDWKNYATFRFVVQLVAGTAFSIFCINMVYRYVKLNFTDAPALPEQIQTLNVYGTLIVLPIIALYFGYKFLKAWRKSELESERLQKENVRSQMMALRNHLDPHFLFNNLNTVSSLIDQDKELSKEYLDKFAEVYRIILRTESSDLATVEEEINLIESYIYLLKIRFQDRVIFKLDIADTDIEKAILPLSIQMLIENAIKHNRFSKKEPITIEIKSTGDGRLMVRNNLQIKKFDQSRKSGTGLRNIKDRYKYFTDQELVLEQNADFFTVYIPLLEVEYD